MATSNPALYCSTCDIWVPTLSHMTGHLQGSRHIAASSRISVVVCPSCDVKITSADMWDIHVQGKRHRKNNRPSGIGPSVQPTYQSLLDLARPPSVPAPIAPTPSIHRQCDICHVVIEEREWAIHVASTGHIDQAQLLSLSTAERIERGVNSVTLTPPVKVDFGFFEAQEPGVGRLSEVIRITATTRTIKFIGALIPSKNPVVDTKNFIVTSAPTEQTLTRGDKEALVIQFRPHKKWGRIQDQIELNFLDSSTNQAFTISHPLEVVVGVENDLLLLSPVAPYIRPEPHQREAEGEIIPGEKPAALEAIPSRIPLGHYPISGDIYNVLDTGTESDQIRGIQNLLPSSLNRDGALYQKWFTILLHVEEHRIRKDLQTYDMRGVTLSTDRVRWPGYHFLEVPDQRPSVIVGDTIKVRVQGSFPLDRWFEGYVHVVRGQEVGLKFDRSFRSYSGQLCDVHFELGRFSLRRMHQAVDTPFYIKRILFPSAADLTMQDPTEVEISQVSLVNHLIAGNHTQMTAVAAIRNRPPGSPPFVISGPSGTGKTMTMIESIHQVLAKDTTARILACAPSNSAADLLAEGLRSIGNYPLFRLNAPSRPSADLPYFLMPYSRLNERNVFSVPPLSVFRAYRIIVSTCISAGMIEGIGVPRGHFSHIFIDGSDQAMEPEVMIPIRTMAKENTHIILSGDPKQRGPIIRSDIAATLGLATSYFKHITRAYERTDKPGGSSRIVKLTQNYRNHPAILSFLNEKFYDNVQQAHGDPESTNRLLRWKGLPCPTFPIVFYAIKGEDMREAGSPFFFNPHEASLVKRLINDLREDRSLDLVDSDFGVISPYPAQCRKLRALLQAKFGGIKVGAAKEFQGQERPIIIISTVQSSEEHRHCLLTDSLWLNAAMTRAKALLILVGDPKNLALDGLWKAFLNYIYQNGGWTGNEIPWDPEVDGGKSADQTNDLQQRFQSAMPQDDAVAQASRDDAQDIRDQVPFVHQGGI